MSKKVLVIGLDGAPFPLIEKWAAEGLLPNLAELIERGSFGILRSTMPVHSPTAWASFITGMNPGKHGVFDFVRREVDSYRLQVVRANEIAGASLWQWLSENGRTVGVMNVPMTYPPETVNGFLITGLGTPDYVNYTHPPELSQELNTEGYRVNKKFFFTPDRADEWLEDIYDVTDLHGETAVRLIQEKPWDFFMVVFRNTDEICHFFWHHMDPTHPWHNPKAPEQHRQAIQNLYQQVDAWVGKLKAAAGDDTNIVIMSDHGAGPLYKDVFINEWLWQKGWLKLREEIQTPQKHVTWLRQIGLTRKNISDTLTRLGLHRVEVLIKKVLGDKIYVLPRDERPEFNDAIDWAQTKAYSFGYYGQIFINLQGREPQGIVSLDTEYEALRQKIAHELKQLTDPADGHLVIDRIFFKEDLYHGPFLETAPDMLAIMRDFTYMTRKGYEFADKRGILFKEPYTVESGSHRLEGILIAAGPDIAAQPTLASKDIQDLTPTILQLLHCPIPYNMDGQIIREILTPKFQSEHPITYTDKLIERSSNDNTTWTPALEAEMTDRLKKLGYLG